MPNPNQHDQPAEGGPEAVENTLRKQQSPDPKGQQKSQGDRQPQDKSKPPSR